MITMKKKSCSKAGDVSLSDLVFSWSIEDVLNNNLFKGKVERIPEKFSSVADYLNSFKQPLIEETRADFCSGLDSLAQSPACEISSVHTSKHYKPPKDLYYDIITKKITDLENNGGHYEPEGGDIFVLTDVRPKTIGDVIRPGKPFLVAMVVSSSEGEPKITILSSEKFDTQTMSKERERLFATYMMNLTTNMRIWRALNADPQGANIGLIPKVLQYDAAVDDGCALCLSQEPVRVKGWNVLDFVGSLGLDESQKSAVLSSISMRNCQHQKHNVKLIWGPPGTGKTKTVASLLFALLKLKCRTLTCAPTNIAVLQVAERLVRLFLKQSSEHDTYGLGDIILSGNKKRMKIDDYDELVDVFLEYRRDILSDCLKSTHGWKYTLEGMISLLKNPQERYNDYVKSGKEKHKDKDDSQKRGGKNEVGGNEKETCSQNLKGSKKDKSKHSKEIINQALRENKKKAKKKWKTKEEAGPSEKSASDPHNKGNGNTCKETESEDLMTYDEFLRKTFSLLAERLTFFAKSLYTHLPTSLLPLHVAKEMIRLIDQLKTLENAGKKFGNFAELMATRKGILSILNLLYERFPGLNFEGSVWDLCLLNARLIFCTASSSIKVKGTVEMVVIDEAAQLKECESAIPLQIRGLRNVILIGDDRQLPAMVRSQASEDAKFGRSLFQRFATIGKKKHLLNIQYRMHPSISLFPNEAFYENRIIDSQSVKERSYYKSFLKGNMYGSYSFINVAKGRECFEKGHSPRNVKEAAVIDQIIAQLFKGYCILKQKVSIGVISPYKGQVGLIQERLGKKYDNHKKKGFSVHVRSVDGFQGGEEDIIIISTVRCNGNGSVGFLSNHQRTNVALTRARYCLWIVGSGTTLANSRTVWKDLVINAKTRGCFYNANDEGMDLHQAVISQSHDKVDFNYFNLGKVRWKVFFSGDFKISIGRRKSNKLHKQVMEMLKELADGWRWANSKNLMDASVYGVASELLELYKVNEQLYLAWTVDILKEESKYTQVIKIWNILPASKIQELVMELNLLFRSYTVGFTNCCKYKSFEGYLVVPMSWPLHSSSRSSHMLIPVNCLSDRLAAVNLRDNQGESSSSFSKSIK